MKELIFEFSDLVHETGKDREVIVELFPLFARVRLKGLRDSYDVSWSAIWSMGVKNEVESKRREKRKR